MEMSNFECIKMIKCDDLMHKNVKMLDSIKN